MRPASIASEETCSFSKLLIESELDYEISRGSARAWKITTTHEERRQSRASMCKFHRARTVHQQHFIEKLKMSSREKVRILGYRFDVTREQPVTQR